MVLSCSPSLCSLTSISRLRRKPLAFCTRASWRRFARYTQAAESRTASSAQTCKSASSTTGPSPSRWTRTVSTAHTGDPSRSHRTRALDASRHLICGTLIRSISLALLCFVAGHDFSKEDAKIEKARLKFSKHVKPQQPDAANSGAGAESGANGAASAAPVASAAPSSSVNAAATTPSAAAVSAPSPAASVVASASTTTSTTSDAAISAVVAAAAAVTISLPVAAAASSPTSSSSASSSPSSAAAVVPVPAAVSLLPTGASFSSLVGRTPLVRLRSLSELTGCEVLAKAEYANPGGSIKDRAALAILRGAEAAGQLVPGKPGWIVEGTAGNTGVGLTLAGAERGYRTIVVLAANNSQEKKDALRSIGATLLEVPMVPFSNPNNYVHVAKRVYEALKTHMQREQPDTKVILADQSVLQNNSEAKRGSQQPPHTGGLYAHSRFLSCVIFLSLCCAFHISRWSNPANRAAHFESTGPEIWSQTGGRVDAFCCGVGTGGTLSGVSLYLKGRKPQVKSVLVDPEGSALKDYFESGALRAEGASVAEGIGQGRLCDNLVAAGFRPDMCVRVLDRDALPRAFDLLQQEGLSVGSSSAINITGAYQVARLLGPGHTVVTVLCDSGTRYASKLSNPDFLREKQLPVPSWLDAHNANTNAMQQLAANMLQQAVEVGHKEIERKEQLEKEEKQKQQAATVAE